MTKRKEKQTYLEGYYWTKVNRNLLYERIQKGENDPSLTRRFEYAEDKLREIRETILEVEDGRLRVLLELRYIDNKSLEQVAEEMDLSYGCTTKLHLKAVDSIRLGCT